MQWIKLHCNKWFIGSTRWELNKEERSVWIDCLVRAGLNEPSGRIDYYNLKQLADLFQISIEELILILNKFVELGKISWNEGTITILNWEKYQSDTNLNRSINMRKSNIENSQNMRKSNIENSNKNRIDKNVLSEKPTHKKKKVFLENVFLTEEEHQKLIHSLGKEKAEDYITRLNDYIHQIGKRKAEAKYKSHYHVILNWHRRETTEFNKRLKVIEILQQKKEEEYFK